MPTVPRTPEPSPFVRVRDEGTGHEYTLARPLAESIKGVTIVDKPALDRDDRPLPPKLRTTLAANTQATGELPDGAADRAATETA